MYTRSLGGFLGQSFGVVILIGIVFALLNTFHITSGHFIDWAIGTVTAWWLFVIVTVPWDVHFEAKGVIYEADRSSAIGIPIDQDQLSYAKKVSRRALVVAILLHLISSITLFLLSYYRITPIGYIASAAALLLTGLRPAIRAYEYLWERLMMIKHQVKYPREDVVELRARVQALEGRANNVDFQLDGHQPNSFAWQQNRTSEDIRQRLNNLNNAHQKLELTNNAEHLEIRREGQNAIAQISADAQFLEHVREIIRMIKSA